MEIINLTPHMINIHNPDGLIVDIPPSGDVARVGVTTEPVDSIGNIIVYRNIYGEAENLPEPLPGVYYIVSMVVRMAAPDRQDVLSPGELIRDSHGQPKGCLGLVMS